MRNTPQGFDGPYLEADEGFLQGAEHLIGMLASSREPFMVFIPDDVNASVQHIVDWTTQVLSAVKNRGLPSPVIFVKDRDFTAEETNCISRSGVTITRDDFDTLKMISQTSADHVANSGPQASPPVVPEPAPLFVPAQPLSVDEVLIVINSGGGFSV